MSKFKELNIDVTSIDCIVMLQIQKEIRDLKPIAFCACSITKLMTEF